MKHPDWAERQAQRFYRQHIHVRVVAKRVKDKPLEPAAVGLMEFVWVNDAASLLRAHHRRWVRAVSSLANDYCERFPGNNALHDLRDDLLARMKEKG